MFTRHRLGPTNKLDSPHAMGTNAFSPQRAESFRHFLLLPSPSSVITSKPANGRCRELNCCTLRPPAQASLIMTEAVVRVQSCGLSSAPRQSLTSQLTIRLESLAVAVGAPHPVARRLRRLCQTVRRKYFCGNRRSGRQSMGGHHRTAALGRR